MNIAIDGYEANSTNRVGVGRFALEILVHLSHEIDKNSRNDTVSVYVPGNPTAILPQTRNNWRYKIAKPKALWTFFGLPLSLYTSKPKIDVVYSPTHYIPRFVSTPRVMTIMDVSYLEFPQLFRPEDLHKLVHWTAYSVRHAAKIITISEFSKRAIIDAYHVPGEMVQVAYPSLPKSVPNVMDEPNAQLSLPDRYILSVGTLQPRKNYTRLIEAFSLLEDHEIELVIVGKKGWLYEDILSAPTRFGVSNRVRFMDFVTDGELQVIYKKATCFVLPSLYEGFGLPVLEAMSYGVPVVVSNASSLPEIAADAGIYIDPTDTKSIHDGLKKAITLDAKTKSNFVSKGLLRTKVFSWEKAAKKVMNVLIEVGGKGK